MTKKKNEFLVLEKLNENPLNLHEGIKYFSKKGISRKDFLSIIGELSNNNFTKLEGKNEILTESGKAYFENISIELKKEDLIQSKKNEIVELDLKIKRFEASANKKMKIWSFVILLITVIINIIFKFLF